MIPKIIHYCWLSNDEVPIEFKNYIEKWKEKLPDYTFKKWNFDCFDINSSEWVREAFENKKYAFACDYIRLYAIYHYGGIYMDMDVEVVKGFDTLLAFDYMLAYESIENKGIEAGCFGAVPGSPFIEQCLAYYKGRHFVLPNGDFDQRPLPQIMNEVLINSNFKINLYNWKYFTAKSYDTGIESPDESTYTIHHFAGSWKTDYEKKEAELYQKLSQKYGKWGSLLYKVYKYGLHPWKLVNKLNLKEKGN